MKNNVKERIKYHLFCVLSVMLLHVFMLIVAFYCHRRRYDRDIILMLFMVGVLVATVATKRLLYGLITSVVSVIIFNYFFTPPYHGFTVELEQDVITLVTFLIAALGCGMLAADWRKQAEVAREKEKRARFMYEVTEGFVSLTGIENIVRRGLEYIVRQSGYPCSVHLDAQDGPKDFYSENYRTDDRCCGCSVPIAIGEPCEKLGILYFPTVPKLQNKYEDNLVKSILFQMALAMDREYSYLKQEKIKQEMESERLRGNLIRSISHDIRTPLTGIIGASSVIVEHSGRLEAEQIRKLAADINEEASWLMITVENILDMTRIMEGTLEVCAEYESVDDLINEAVVHLPAAFDRNRLKIDMPGEILVVKVDGRLLVKVIFNLLDNAFKYAGEESVIRLSARQEKHEVVFEVADNGGGIDPAVAGSLFEQFVTLPQNALDQGRGVGLGLSICRSIVTAMNGTICAHNRPEGGAVFQVRLPCEEETQ